MAATALASLSVPQAELKAQNSPNLVLSNASLPASYRKNPTESLSLPAGASRVEWGGAGSSRGFEIVMGAGIGFMLSSVFGLGVRKLRNSPVRFWAAVSGITTLSALTTAVAVPDQITFTSHVEQVLEQASPRTTTRTTIQGKRQTMNSVSEYPQILRISELNYDLSAKPINSPFKVGEKISVILRHKGNKLLYWNAEKL